jgi:ABC-type Fe3+/spermidine/putrescine transport system ATPase subunit
VRDGECLVLLGPSGCGKTTLLNVIAGAVPLRSGRLTLGERVLDNPDARRFVPMDQRGFSMVYQDFSLWPHMTVADNVGFGLRVRRIPRAERETRIRGALRKVRMLEYADRRPSSLSGGQQQRVAIARALAVQPAVLLMDEPLSALDAKLREELKGELTLLLEETGQTAVYVTHDQSEAYALGDQVALMRGGRIEQCGEPEEIYSRPLTDYVADFLGGANLFSFEQRDGRLILGGLGACPERKDFPAAGTCFLRRECLAFRPASGPHSLTCVLNQFLGGHYSMNVRTGEGAQVFGLGCKGAQPGDAVEAVFDVRDLGLIPAGARS